MNMIFRGQNDNKLTILRGLIKYHACVRGACVHGAARENRQKQLSERLARDQCTYRERLLIIFKILFLFLYQSSLSKYRRLRTRLLLTSSCIHQGEYIAINQSLIFFFVQRSTTLVSSTSRISGLRAAAAVGSNGT